MPKIPMYEASIGLPAMQSPRMNPAAAGAEFAAMGQFAETVGNTVQNLSKQYQEIKGTEQYTKSLVESQKAMADLYDQTINSPEFIADPEAGKAKYQEAMDSLREQYRGKQINGAFESRFQQTFENHALTHSLHIAHTTRQQTILNSLGTFSTASQEMQNNLLRAGSDLQSQQIRDDYDHMLDDYVSKGAIRSDQAPKLRQQWHSGADKAIFTGVLTKAGPEAASRALGGLKHISEEDRAQLLAQIQPLLDAQTSRRIAGEPFTGEAASAGPSVDFSSPGGSTKNNLGNIRSGPKSFRAYETPEEGAADAAALLRKGYRNMDLLGIANKWAPASDGNNPTHWANVVSKVSGLPVGEKPNLDDPDTVSRLLKGIATIEKEDPARFTPEIISRGVERALSGGSKSKATPSPAPVTSMDFESMEEQVKARAEQLKPGDAVFKDHALSQFRQEFNARKTAERLRVEGNRDTLTRAVVDPNGPKNMQELLSDPARASAYSELLRTEPSAIQPVMHALEAKAKHKDPDTSARTYYELLGLADRDREAFASKNLLEDYPNLEDSKWHELVVLQQHIKAGKKDAQVETMRQAINGEIDAFYPKKKEPKGGSALDEWNVSKANAFTAVEEAVKKELEASGKKFVPPERVREIARGYLVNGVVSGTGGWFSRVEKGKGFEKMDNPAFVPDQAQVPDRFRKAIADVDKASKGKSKAEARFDPQTREWYLIVDGKRYDYKGN